MPQQQTSSPGQGQRFDWWAAPATASPPAAGRPTPGTRSAATRTERTVPTQPVPPVPPAAPIVPAAAPAAVPASVPAGTVDSTEVYRTVQASEAFQDIRRSHRSFVFPVSSAFLAWYLAYVAAQAAAPELMRTPVAGPLNIAWLLGLLQFASTFLLTWLYARNARTKRDRAALGLRWDTQDQLR
ncbi:DUF485 domain-containing protein [Streptomyces sp. SP17BM10]|uniref:DUF485 domain-containing protein n=1 Tax=Streptomyces sp. SP17BM10 TaxID=3002530 RepID=UPI002E796758|nr:DUF485 domain-containing protein [Streptomyces sp. SP17BM10]MEE1781819.1 DUF485 domain-containing protein [Streptomyces sp. SP17BM10]